MSRANLVTKLGQVELARLTHEYLDRNHGVFPAAIGIHGEISFYRVYGKFRDLGLITKIRNRRVAKFRDLRKKPVLVDRLRKWRVARMFKLFRTVFPVIPSGGTSVYVQWQIEHFSCLGASQRTGYYNHRTTSVTLKLRLHPHWQRRLGAVCLEMNRFFLDVCYHTSADPARKGVLWGWRFVRAAAILSAAVG